MLRLHREDRFALLAVPLSMTDGRVLLAAQDSQLATKNKESSEVV
jgi:hypothetical protein